MEIVFVCTGNTCRSPLAESIAKSLSNNHTFTSRGIYATEGIPASRFTKQIIAEEQLPDSTLSQAFDATDSRKDLILTMTRSHRDTIRAMYPESNVYTLIEYAEGEARDVADPYGGDYEIYHHTYDVLRANITKILTKIDKN